MSVSYIPSLKITVHLNERPELVLGVHMKGFYNWASEDRKKMKLCELKVLTPFPPAPSLGRSKLG